MTTTEKAAQEAVAEIVPHLENINCRLNAYGKDQLRVIITRKLAPLQSELDSRREESTKLEKLVEKLSKAAPGCKGAPDPIDHGFVCLDYLLGELDHQVNAARYEGHSWFRDQIAEALNEAGAPTHHPDIGAPALKPMTPQERIAALKAELDRKDAENKALRQIVSDSVKAIGNGSGCSTEASLEFMQHVPKEISLVVDRKDKLLAEARRLIELSQTTYSGTGSYYREAQDWLAQSSKK